MMKCRDGDKAEGGVTCDNVTETCQEDNESSQEERLFDPPLYKQRYLAVAKIINDCAAQTVVDMGCSEGQFLPAIKELCPTVEVITGVDLDRNTLERHMYRLKPLTIEYILKRQRPLKMSMCHGSIDRPDQRFREVDVLACIEVIEHLYEDVLDKVPMALFGILRPKVAVITTPNCEYNVLFKHFSGMRHSDHKFEWTRQEFKTWCQQIVADFEYDLEISGVGDPPEGSDVGFCSQLAIFTRRNSNLNHDCVDNSPSLNLQNGEDESYELVYEVTYPYDDVNENKREKVLNEVQYIINHIYSDVTDEVEDNIVRPICVDEIMEYPGIKKFDIKKEEFLELINEKYTLSTDKENIVLTISVDDFIRDRWYDDELDLVTAEFPESIDVSKQNPIEDENWD